MEAGVYRTDMGFGYLNTRGKFIPQPNREAARNLARAENIVTTTKGTYQAPSVPKKVRGNRVYKWGDYVPGETIVTVPKAKFNSALTAAGIFRKNHPTFDFTVVKEGDSFTFIRAKASEGERVGIQKRRSWNWSQLEVGESSENIPYKERLKAYNAVVSYMRNHPETLFVMGTDKVEGIAWFERKA